MYASMRPTPEGVGNEHQHHVLVQPRHASMRPTPEGVGNVGVGVVHPHLDALQ